MPKNDWLKMRVLRDDPDPFLEGGVMPARWVVLIGTEVTMTNDTKRLEPCVMLADGRTKDDARILAAAKLRELAALIERGAV